MSFLRVLARGLEGLLRSGLLHLPSARFARWTAEAAAPTCVYFLFLQIFRNICLRSMSQMGSRHNSTKARENRSELKLGLPSGAKKR